MTSRSGVPSRRDALLTGTLLVAACGSSRAAPKAAHADKEDDDEDEDVTPNEDLMREHGALRRILVIYREGQKTPDAIVAAAKLVRTFVEDYHEQLEEQYLFPRFEKAGQLTELVATLRKQHQVGRALTERIQKGDLSAIEPFSRMYTSHAAREDTELFAALPKLVGKHEYHELGERFEDIEKDKLGKQGFEGVLTQIQAIEKQIGIADLNVFTPAV